jgi:hypothetical protein
MAVLRPFLTYMIMRDSEGAWMGSSITFPIEQQAQIIIS